jgi:hypothetical protein
MIAKSVQSPDGIERRVKLGELPYRLVVYTQIEGTRPQPVVFVDGKDAENNRVNGGHREKTDIRNIGQKSVAVCDFQFFSIHRNKRVEKYPGLYAASLLKFSLKCLSKDFEFCFQHLPLGQCDVNVFRHGKDREKKRVIDMSKTESGLAVNINNTKGSLQFTIV